MAAPGILELSLLMNGQKPLWMPECDFREGSLPSVELRGASLSRGQFHGSYRKIKR